MFSNGKFLLQPPTKIVATSAVSIPVQLSIPLNAGVLIDSNHSSSVVLIEESSSGLFKDKYEDLKLYLRKQFPGKPVFPVFNNFEDSLRPIGSGEGDFVTQWLVLTKDTTSFFYGDSRNANLNIDTIKYSKLLIFKCGNPGGGLIDVILILDDIDERNEIRAAIRRQGFSIFKVKGMKGEYVSGQSTIEFVIATEFEIVQEKFVDYRPSLQKLNSITDLNPWRNYGTGVSVPEYMESMILLSSVFYSRYGHASFNLLVLGVPGAGKSFFGEAVCHLCDWKITECAESTAKGLIMSHAKNAKGKGQEAESGKPGVLYTAPYVVALNEFCRIISSAKHSGSEEYNKILSHMNGVVERKSRGKVSGIVDHNDYVMKASLIAFDNDYEHQLDPFMDAMVEDPSYQRRYAILKISDETTARGKLASEIQDISLSEVEVYFLRKHNISPAEWYNLARYMRWEMTRAAKLLPQSDFDKMRPLVDVLKKKHLDKIVGPIAHMDEGTASVRRIMEQANFAQITTACLVSTFVMLNVEAGILKFKSGEHKEFKDPLIGKKGLTPGQFEFAKKMLERILTDFYHYLGPAIQRRSSRPAVKRF